VEKTMKKSKLPRTDSIRKLAEFWDANDLTDFESELEEVAEPIFTRTTAIQVPLETREAKAVERIAHSKGVSREELVRAWIVQRIGHRNGVRPTRRSA
jgi:CopG antitoxin of type II toxin-antitoxin system